jgi:hypothetical protein
MNKEYYEELKLSRELASAIEMELQSYGQVVPESVYRAYQKLKEHYAIEIENGVM